ncbi:MAG: nucleoside kinase [Clostridia bacterium]|nr:nucleoside kinase [Clostridia bacterium]
MENITGVIKTQLDLQKINDMADSDLDNLVKFSAKKYQDEIEVIANNIIYGSKRFVLLSGPSSSGKTTTSHMIAKHLNALGKGCVYISLDDFFINRDQTPILPDGKYDFENFDILDLDKINSCITDLITKFETDLPIFDFVTGTRKKEVNHIEVSQDDVIIIEGTHALNPMLLRMDTSLFYKVYICVYSNFQINGTTIIPAKLLRFMRRLIRDAQTRGTGIEETLSLWNNVCAGEDKYIKPYRVAANYLLDTTHPYEPLLYHTYLEKMLKCSKNPYGIELYEKLQFCGYLTEDVVPDDSLLWEFLVKGSNKDKMLK